MRKGKHRIKFLTPRNIMCECGWESSQPCGLERKHAVNRLLDDYNEHARPKKPEPERKS